MSDDYGRGNPDELVGVDEHAAPPDDRRTAGCVSCLFLDRGGCHRYPPVSVDGGRDFPFVYPDDWCGEYRPADMAPPGTVVHTPGGAMLAAYLVQTEILSVDVEREPGPFDAGIG